MGKNSSAGKASPSSDKSSDYYLHLLQNSKDILFLINAKTGKFEYISLAAAAISGFTSEELTEMGLEGINKRVYPGDSRVEVKKNKDVSEKPSPSNFYSYIEQRFKHKKGHWVWLGINRTFITGSNGQVEAIVGNVRDITETKLLQQKLESSLDDYRSLYNNARVALYRTRISDGKLLECNEALVKFLGYKSREKCLAEYCSVKYYTDLKRRDELLAILKEKGQVDNFEIKVRRISGEEFWMKISSRICPEEGYIEGAAWDITASKILTRVENEILELVMQGKCNKEIAFQLKRSIRTIEDHRANIMQKLGAHNLVELTRKAIDSGIAPEKK